MSRAGQGRGRILAATKDLLWERGYEHMSPRDVLDRASVGQGSLYHHFPGKLELARAALAEMVAEETAAMESIFAQDKPPVVRLEDYLARKREALRGCRIGRLANETIMEVPDFRAFISTYLDHVEILIGRAVSEAQEQGLLQKVADPGALAALFLAVIEGGFVLARAHWDPSRMERAIFGAEAALSLLKR